jgi:exodeoxyribonuclease VII small subunit
MAEAKKNDAEPAPDFEKSLARLEKIVEEMESGSLSLEKMMAHFEEGSGLVQLCNKKLNEVEKKIEILVKKGGEITAQPFQPEAEA